MGTLPPLPLAPRLVRAGVSWVTLEWGRPEGSPSEEQLKYTLEIQEDNSVRTSRQQHIHTYSICLRMQWNLFFLFYNQSHHHWLHPQAVLFKSYCLSPPQGTDFHPKYTGENLTCTVQGLKRSTQYKFRVSCGTIQMSFYFDLNTLSFYFKPRFSSDYCTTSELFFYMKVQIHIKGEVRKLNHTKGKILWVFSIYFY